MKVNKIGRMTKQEFEIWQALSRKCHTHNNENKKAYNRKEKHKKRLDID